MSEGARVWLVPDGFIPEGSMGAQESHEAICVLNTSAEQARLSISFYFEDRDPVKDAVVIVPPERTRHIRTDRIDGVEIPRGVPYAVRIESSVPVTVQCSRMDTRPGPQRRGQDRGNDSERHQPAGVLRESPPGGPPGAG